MTITAGMIAKAAATALSNEKLRKGIGWGLVAVLSPVILLIAALCSIGTGGADHNNQAVAAAFYPQRKPRSRVQVHKNCLIWRQADCSVADWRLN